MNPKEYFEKKSEKPKQENMIMLVKEYSHPSKNPDKWHNQLVRRLYGVDPMPNQKEQSHRLVHIKTIKTKYDGTVIKRICKCGFFCYGKKHFEEHLSTGKGM